MTAVMERIRRVIVSSFAACPRVFLFVLLYEAAVLAVSEAPKLAGSIPARRAGDDETVAVVQTILEEERDAAATLKAAFPEGR
jgi:hypothetical protein